MSRSFWAVLFRSMPIILLVAWALTFIAHLNFPHPLGLYYVSVGLGLLFVVLGILNIISLILSRRAASQRSLVVQRPRAIQPSRQYPPDVTQRRTEPTQNWPDITQRPTEHWPDITQQPTQYPRDIVQQPAQSRFMLTEGLTSNVAPPPLILRVMSKKSVFFSYFVLVVILVAGYGTAITYLRANSCSLIKDKRISINGSTALAPLIQDVANEYQQKCFGANVSINTEGSLSGLRQVEKGSIDVGTSDVFADLYQNPNLKDYQVAVVVFAVVVNDSVDTTNLTTDELKRIYSGNIINWRDAGNNKDLDVVLISRPLTSHIRWAFEKYILGGGVETITGPQELISDREDTIANSIKDQPGAIGYVPLYYADKYHLKILSIDNNNPQNRSEVTKDAYKFWNIEHMYTRGLPESPVKDFISYMFSIAAKQIINKDAYLDPAEFSRPVLTTHVSQE